MLLESVLLAQVSFGAVNLDQMSAEKPYMFVDLGLGEQEKFAVDQLWFDRLGNRGSIQYSRYGELHLLTDELLQFFPKIGSQSEKINEELAALVERIVKNVLQVAEKKSAWVCVRAFYPSAFFDQPRWHMDGRFYGLAEGERCVKFGVALRGAGTLFYDASEEERQVFLKHQKDRDFLETFLSSQHVQQTGFSEGAFFLVADPKISAIHSEPPIAEERLFLSVLPGSEEEIEELYITWGNQK